MRWTVFFIFAYLTLLMQVGTEKLLAYGEYGVTPSLLLILAVYIGMSAPPMTAAWAFLLLGLLGDLTRHYPTGDDQVMWLIGPCTLGMLAGAGVIVQLRVMMYRNSIIAMALLVFTVGIFVNLVTIAMITARGLAWIPTDGMVMWNAADELVRRFYEVVYTALAAVPAGAILLRLVPLWGFQPLKSKGPW